MGKRFYYEPDGAVLKKFWMSTGTVQVIQGPIESGTSTCCVMKLWRLASEQKPGPDMVRRSRWAIVRNTYAELEETTMKTLGS